jgi:hypothetical protein
MGEFKKGDIIVAVSNKCVDTELTVGNEYWVHDTAQGKVMISCDIGRLAWYYSSRFKLKEEVIVNEVNVEKEQYIEMSTSLVYEVAYKGDTLAILKGVQDGREITVNVEYLPSTHFVQLTKEMQKQQKKNEDLGVLANVTDEIRKLLDDNYVICHANVNRDTKGLVEYTVMLGESL